MTLVVYRIIAPFVPSIVFQSVILSIYLLRLKKGARTQSRLLALYFLCLGIILWSFSPWVPRLIAGSAIYLERLTFLIGPLVYLYLRAIFNPTIKLRWHDLLHALPYLCLTIYFFLADDYIHDAQLKENIKFNISKFINLTITLGYFIVSFTRFKLHKLFTHQKFSDLNKPHIFWLKIFIITNILILFFRIFSKLVELDILYVRDWCGWAAISIWVAGLIFFNFIIYILVKVPDRFIRLKKYRKSKIPVHLHQKYLQKLQNLMDTKKPFLDSSLSLNTLAEQTGITTKHLSQIINQSFDLNFNDFINKYRIEECKNILSSSNGNNKNLLEIAYEVGFNSKATFNTSFKKFTGMTPSAYLKSIPKK